MLEYCTQLYFSWSEWKSTDCRKPQQSIKLLFWSKNFSTGKISLKIITAGCGFCATKRNYTNKEVSRKKLLFCCFWGFVVGLFLCLFPSALEQHIQLKTFSNQKKSFGHVINVEKHASRCRTVTSYAPQVQIKFNTVFCFPVK